MIFFYSVFFDVFYVFEKKKMSFAFKKGFFSTPKWNTVP
jgi:hypothetical protein